MVSCKAFAMEGHSIFVLLFIPLVAPAESLTVCIFYGKPVPGNLHFSHLFSNKPCESLILLMEKRKSKCLYN